MLHIHRKTCYRRKNRSCAGTRVCRNEEKADIALEWENITQERQRLSDLKLQLLGDVKNQLNIDETEDKEDDEDERAKPSFQIPDIDTVARNLC